MLHTADGDDRPPARDMAALLASHPHQVDGDELRQGFDTRGIQFGPAFTGLACAHTAEGTGETVLAEVGMPGSIRAQQGAYGVHPALLDACFQSVAAHPAVQGVGNGGLLLPLGVRRLRSYGPARHARYCYATVTACGVGVEADPAQAARLRDQLGTGGFTGVVVLTAPQNGNPDNESPVHGSEHVKQMVRIARELPEIVGQAPRLYVLTRNAQKVLPDDRPNLEQGGLRGLLRVIGAEHPHLKVSYIDLPHQMDEQTGAESVARQLLAASGG